MIRDRQREPEQLAHVVLESQWARLEQRGQLVAIQLRPSLDLVELVALKDQ